MNNKFSIFFSASLLLFSCNHKNPNLDGKRLYEDKCLNCHQEKGQGVGKLIPPLTDKTYLQINRKNLPCIIQNGLEESIEINDVLYSEKMPKTEKLTHADMVNILNYIGQNWGNDLDPFTIKEVSENLKNCK